jgi:hypothetical protein
VFTQRQINHRSNSETAFGGQTHGFLLRSVTRAAPNTDQGLPVSGCAGISGESGALNARVIKSIIGIPTDLVNLSQGSSLGIHA